MVFAADPCALNAVVAVNGVPHRVWFANPAPRNGVWLIAPNGVMHWAAKADVVVMDRAPEAGAFPAVAPAPMLRDAAFAVAA